MVEWPSQPKEMQRAKVLGTNYRVNFPLVRGCQGNFFKEKATKMHQNKVKEKE
jgi:hypothetical protein